VAAAVGTLDVALTTTSKALVYDLVGPEEAVNGIALETLADKLFGVFGALLAGVLLARVGGTAAFGAMSVAYLLGALSLDLRQNVVGGVVAAVLETWERAKEES